MAQRLHRELRKDAHDESQRYRPADRRTGLRQQREQGQGRLHAPEAWRHRRRLHLRWRADHAVSNRRRRAYRPRADRLHRRFMGQPRHAHVRAGAVPPGDDDRSFRERHRDGAQREKAVPRHQAGHRYTCAGGCLCVRHLRHGDGRRRSLGRLQGRRRALGRAGNSDRRGRVLRFQETRRPYRRPDDVRPCHRHPRAGPGARVGAASGHHGA